MHDKRVVCKTGRLYSLAIIVVEGGCGGEAGNKDAGCHKGDVRRVSTRRLRHVLKHRRMFVVKVCSGNEIIIKTY